MPLTECKSHLAGLHGEQAPPSGEIYQPTTTHTKGPTGAFCVSILATKSHPTFVSVFAVTCGKETTVPLMGICSVIVWVYCNWVKLLLLSKASSQ